MKRDKIREHKPSNGNRLSAKSSVLIGKNRTEQRLRAALLASGTGTFFWNLRTNKVEWDEGMERLFGLPRGTAPTRAGDFLKFVNAEDVPTVQSALTHAEQFGANYKIEFRITLPDGKVRWIGASGQVVVEGRGGSPCVTGICVDVTQSKLADEMVRRYELLAKRSRDVILFVHADDGRILEANAAATVVYGYNSEELKSLTINDLRSPNTRYMTSEQMGEAMTRGIVFETLHRHKNGCVFPVEVSSEGALIGNDPILVSVIRDISERRRFEEQLVAAKELAERSLGQLRATIDSMSEGMFIIYPDCTIAMANPAFFRMYGFEPGSSASAAAEASDMLDRYDTDGQFLPVELWPVSAALHGKTIVQREMIIRRKDTGKEYVISANAAPVHDSCGNVTMAVATVEDITDKKRAEKALIRSEKLAAGGRLASMIAHEINNPLEAAMNLTYLLKSTLPDAKSQEYLDLLTAQLGIIDRITNQTLKLQRDSAKPARFRLCDLVKDLLAVYENKITKSGVSIETRYEQDCSVTGYSSEIRQVVSNLLINALDATSAGGKIVIHIFESADWRSGEGRGCRMSIADTGSGIAPEHRSRIFEPFFTTKGENGTGLGLWVSSGIISRAGGSLRVWSTQKPGRSGTVFSIFLPDSSL